MDFICQYNTLNLSDKGLKELPEIESYINFVDCSNNNIEYIESIPDNVISLNCGFNPLKSLDFVKNSKLRYLYIQGVKFVPLREIPNTLMYLDCRHCHLESLPDLKNITILNCKGNKIKELILNDFIGTLDASKNLLTNINKFPSNLRYLDLSHNKLKNIPPLHEYIMYLQLGKNPFDVNNLPPIPTNFCVLSFARMIFKDVPGIDDTTPIKYLNGDEIDISTNISLEEYSFFDKRIINTRNMFKIHNIKCIDIIMSDEYNIAEYLGKNTNNIIIESNGILHCYRRNELKKHIMTFVNTFINQISSIITSEKLYKLYMREYISKEDLDNIMNRKYSVYKLEKTERNINYNGNLEKVYKVSCYTFLEYMNI